MKSVINPMFEDDFFDESNETNFNLDNYLMNSDSKKTHINLSHFNLCESFGSRVLGLSGLSLLAYRLIGSFAINNYARHNGLYCCFSFVYLANKLNCRLSSAKRVIKSLIDKKIIVKIGRGFNGRNCYKVLRIYEFDYFGALLSYYETLGKKVTKKGNLKNKDNKINNFGLPLWVNFYGNYERFLSNRSVNDNEIYKIASYKWINKE